MQEEFLRAAVRDPSGARIGGERGQKLGLAIRILEQSQHDVFSRYRVRGMPMTSCVLVVFMAMKELLLAPPRRQ
jgi:hypothetical protein